VEIKELLLAAGERLYVDDLCDVMAPMQVIGFRSIRSNRAAVAIALGNSMMSRGDFIRPLMDCDGDSRRELG
jgi:hypothetical protein